MDRLKNAFDRLVKTFAGRLDYLALYPARVVSMDVGAQSVELRPDDARVPDLTDVPLRHGLPGVEVEVEKDARVLLGFEGGDPSRPFAMLWQGETLKGLKITAQAAVEVQCEAATVTASGDVAVEARGNARLKGMNVAVEAQGNAEVRASGQAVVKGATVQLGNGGPGVAYQGAAVQAGPFAGTVTLGSVTVTTGV